MNQALPEPSDQSDGDYRMAFCPRVLLTLVIREVADEHIFVAECPEIPGCVSQGKTLGDAAANIRRAVRPCLSVMFAGDSRSS